MKILALGPAGTHGHEAAKIIIGQKQWHEGIEIEFCERNVEILKGVEQERCLGIAPIENTTAGLVTEVIKGYWMKQQLPPTIRVIAELTLPIEHHLLVHPSVQSLEQITDVVSHPQALQQCASNLDKLGIKRRRPSQSTAAAAAEITSLDSYKAHAALASRFAAEVYNLKVIQEHIEDIRGNQTRFHVLGHESVAPTGNDRTALLFRVIDKPRSLLNALWAISADDANMSSIHSIPLGLKGHYAFYCEFDCHLETPKGQGILNRLRTVADNIIVLGSFPQDYFGN